MASKRSEPPDAGSLQPAKKQRKGFSVGPANLPDGTYKRKVQKIKKDLVHKATVRRSYAKLKAREGLDKLQNAQEEQAHDGQGEEQEQNGPPPPPISLEPHPARQMMMDSHKSARSISPEAGGSDELKTKQARQQRRKPLPFAREAHSAQRAREEAEERRRQIEAGQKERAQKMDERERWRREMAKARSGGPGGRRKLGRESKVLLEKVKKLMG